MKKLSLVLAIGFASAGANAAIINYSDFSDLSAFQLNGSTAVIANPASPDSSLRLTDGLGQSGSAFLTNTISLNNRASFSARFDFRITDPIGIWDDDGVGADGIAFVVQTVSNTAGGAGGGIGYANLPNSVGIEFDTYYNWQVGDVDGNHVGIDIAGNITSAAQKPVATRMNNGDVWTAWIDYDGVSDLLEVRLSDTGVRSNLAFLSMTVDLENILGTPNAFVGFTSGTGDAGGKHDILNFEFRDDFKPIDGPTPVPESGSLMLFLLGLLGLAHRRFR